jgi:hypothetical protein
MEKRELAKDSGEHRAKAKSKSGLTTEATRHREHSNKHTRKTSNPPL